MFKSQSNHRHSSGPPGVVTEAQTVKNLLAVQETQLRSLEKEMTTHTSILAWGIPWTEKPGGLRWGHKGHYCELPDVQDGFRKGRGTRDQIANICWIIEKAREFQKNIYFCFSDYAKAFDCVDHNKLWKILKEMGISDHLTCLLRNLYAGQEATNWTCNNRLVPNRKWSTSRLYIVTLLI